MLTLLRRAVLFESSRSHPQQLLTVFRAERSLLVDIPTGWEPRTEQQPTGLIAHPAAQGRAVRILPVAQKKKSPGTMCLGFSWCSKAIQIRTISLGCDFCRFSKGDGLCTFFIVEGYQNLIIIQVNRIDEGIHQCLPLVFQAHVQLAKPQQPKADKFLFDLGFCQRFLCNASFKLTLGFFELL